MFQYSSQVFQSILHSLNSTLSKLAINSQLATLIFK